MKTFAITGRCNSAPPPAGWREALCVMLGAKPRRIGNWAELGLYGALRCLSEAGEKSLSTGAQVWLGSLRGTYVATGTVLGQMQDDLPMPLAFLQTQPSQLLAMLAARMDWKGHACFVAGSNPEALLRLAAAQSGEEGLLLGWVDETEVGITNWLRLRPCGAVTGNYAVAAAGSQFSGEFSHLRLENGQLELRLPD